MRRRLFASVTIISLLICLGLAVLEYWSRGRFIWIKKDRPLSGTYMARVIAPLWSVTDVAAFLPLTWTTLAVRTRRRERYAGEGHLCRKCGYDLRATPERCPECGTEPLGAP